MITDLHPAPVAHPATITDLDWVRQLHTAGYRLRRSWPRDDRHLLLEVVDSDGRTTAGQWFADPARARKVRARTAQSRLLGPVLVQPGGGDRKLTDLATILARPGHQLLAHRPERRAVLCTPDGYLKLVRPSRHAGVLERARVAASLGLGAPAVLGSDPTSGTVATAALPGQVLTDLLERGDTGPCVQVGARLAQLHRAAPPAGTPRHGPEEELQVLRRWTGLAEQYGLAAGQRLPRLPMPRRQTLIHRDFHDGQVLVDGDRIGLLDFDLMAVGDPALDLANFIAQLELRGVQGRLADPAAAIGATLDGYRPDADVRAALPAYLAAARIRLGAVYAFRDPGLPS